ncbi:hepatic leukemia factor-like isoform X2 [Dreissena polymorpha]|uniref:hepatic leukemia factor-like isoform X2 n=1 Tax=Dreissena polymorpha TaxID=45954 RepID=UPI002264EA53|nr:hepatic leukemia factor-like isoform X2 [Dreissena polymorpha]
MSDGTFCDFPGQLDSAMLQQMAGYSGRGLADNLGDGHHSASSKALAGFYMEQFAQSLPSHIMDSLAMSAMSVSNHGNQEMLLAGMMSQASAAASYENAVNFAMKSEKGLPPTPPEEQKEAHNTHHGYHSNSHPASMVGMPSSFNHNLLAKPVPMRRISDKRVSHGRSSLSETPAQPPTIEIPALPESSNPTFARALAAMSHSQKRPRSEKKAIPDEQKDDKYFERRKRNNNAAKKSRDSRKAREDEIAIRASFLEKENAILRAQVGTLREEANSLRQLLLQKRSTARH